MYRFAIEEVYRQQEHVLDEKGERLMSLSSRLSGAPNEAYQALSTADAKFPEVTLSTGEKVTMSYAPVPRGAGDEPPPARSPRGVSGALRHVREERQHLRVAVSQRVPARLVPCARARLQNDARCRAARQQHSALGGRHADRSHARRRRAAAPLSPAAPPRAEAGEVLPVRFLDSDHRVGPRAIAYDSVLEPHRHRPWRRSAPDYQARMWRGFRERWIDVYENDGKRSGAYSAPVYGVHPYMLMNWADTLDDVFTLAHEMGHSMHTMLSHERQPFVYSDYTIFVAEVPSTLSEALLLDHWLATAADKDEQIVLLQHAIDNITSTFYTQVLFADFELAAHELVERDEPITVRVAERLYIRSGSTRTTATRWTWSR